MKDRYKKFVYRDEKGICIEASASKGMIFDISDGANGELIIEAINSDNSELPNVSAGEYAEVLSVYTDKAGNKAVIPPGWTVSGISKENTIWGKDVSLVIYRIPKEELSKVDWEKQEEVYFLQCTYDQFVWVPVDLLDCDGTLDGENFSEKFGRRNYWKLIFDDTKYDEPKEKLLEQLESVKKYGGYYISRYTICKVYAKPQSVKGFEPWVKIDFYNAKKVASTIESNEVVRSHLPFGAEYDSVLAWFIKSGTKTFSEVAFNSSSWGNYASKEKSSESALAKTGSSERWSANNIYDLAGNVSEWTQEKFECFYKVVRSGSWRHKNAEEKSVYFRSEMKPATDCNLSIGFRAVLCIK